MKKNIRIGTRKSKLAIRQAEMVRSKLSQAGVESELELITSEGDHTQDTKDYIIEGSGIFTKAIDDAIISGQVDIGVHSLKDMLPILNERLTMACVLERDDPSDVLVPRNKDFIPSEETAAVIASGSIRRKAQWLNRYSSHIIVPIRGNIDTRLEQLQEKPWDGIILAAAGLNRLEMNVNRISLDWMVPAPGQGIIAVVAGSRETWLHDILTQINHFPTMIAAKVEKNFLGYLGTGCSAPVGALAQINNEMIRFSAQVLSVDGKHKITINLECALESYSSLASKAAELAFDHEAKDLIRQNNTSGVHH
ncbi:MAG TPA: hydroxymethylbilane synthase [Cyclobacteriaceae bacterium]|nr:hydroxymethylbilane synthase [Cyclobacteriaceae bacterium]